MLEPIKLNPQISIVIVNWNGLKWLDKCLATIFAQTYKDFEVIFVDNGSTDESISFVKKNYSQVVVIESEKNLGFAGGNNLGIDRAKGEYILLLNNDTWIENDFLEKLLEGFIDSNCDVVSPFETEYTNASYQKIYTNIDLLGHQINHKYKSSDPTNVFYLSGACLFFTKELYISTGGLDNNFFMYMEEVDWFWRLHLQGKKVHILNDLFFYHAGAGSTGDGIKYNTFLWRNENTLQMLLKNYKLYNLFWVLPLYFFQNIVEMVFFVILLKPKISGTYIKSWIFNVSNLKLTLAKRKIIQQSRVAKEGSIIKKMYWGPAKFSHLISFYIH